MQCAGADRAGPNGVAVVDGRVYGATPTSVFALRQRVELPQQRPGRRIERDQHPTAGCDLLLAGGDIAAIVGEACRDDAGSLNGDRPWLARDQPADHGPGDLRRVHPR
jgi:hypothetical protein